MFLVSEVNKLNFTKKKGRERKKKEKERKIKLSRTTKSPKQNTDCAQIRNSNKKKTTDCEKNSKIKIDNEHVFFLI